MTQFYIIPTVFDSYDRLQNNQNIPTAKNFNNLIRRAMIKAAKPSNSDQSYPFKAVP